MSKANKAIKYRIYPTAEQRDLFSRTFGCSRFVYNQMLALSKDAYAQGETLCSRNKFNYLLTDLKKTYLWLSEVDSTALTSANDALASAFKDFFAKKAKFPKFHKKKYSASYTTKHIQSSKNIEIGSNFVKLPKAGIVKAVIHRLPQKYFIKIDKWYPSSQICHNCGTLHPEMKDLNNRKLTCDCGLTINRDYNAAINIKNEGLRILLSA